MLFRSLKAKYRVVEGHCLEAATAFCNHESSIKGKEKSGFFVAPTTSPLTFAWIRCCASSCAVKRETPLLLQRFWPSLWYGASSTRTSFMGDFRRFLVKLCCKNTGKTIVVDGIVGYVTLGHIENTYLGPDAKKVLLCKVPCFGPGKPHY